MRGTRASNSTPPTDLNEVNDLTAVGPITIRPSGDLDDYFTLETIGGIPTITPTGAPYLGVKAGRGATYVVAASDAPAHVKAQADYVCDGTADNVQIQAAIEALPSTGGLVALSSGRFVLAQYFAYTGSYISVVGTGSGAEQDTGFSGYMASAGTTLYIAANDAAVRFAQEGGNNVRSCYLGNLGIKSTSGTYANSFGVVLDAAYGFRAENVRVADVGQTAFYSTTSHGFDDVKLINCMAVNNGNGFNFAGGSQLWLLYCYTNANVGWGYIFNGVVDAQVLGNVSDGNPSGGFLIGGATIYRLDFAHNHAYGALGGSGIGYDISVADGVTNSNVTLLDNTSGPNLAVDYRVIVGAGGALQFSDISHNKANSGAVSLQLTGAGQLEYTTITDNSLYGSTPVTDTIGGKLDVTIRGNKGFVTENQGGVSNVTLDGSGVGVIAHGCSITPTYANVICQSANLSVRVTSIDATNINITVLDLAGDVVTADTHDFYWEAK